MPTQGEVYLAKCERACRDLLPIIKEYPAVSLIVYGSLARGTLGMGSDIDIMVVIDTDAKQISKMRKQIERSVPNYFEDEFPYVDVRVARKEVFDIPEDSEYGKYISNVKKDGAVVWKR